MICTMSGWRGLRGVWPAVLVCGGSFAVVQFYTSNYIGSRLVDVAAGLASLIALTLFVKIWKPRDIWRFADEAAVIDIPVAKVDSRAAVISAWFPWALLSVCVFAWGLQDVKSFFDEHTTVKFAVPGLDQQVLRIGCTFEGVLRRYQTSDQGVTRDTAMFSIVGREWPEVKARLEAMMSR